MKNIKNIKNIAFLTGLLVTCLSLDARASDITGISEVSILVLNGDQHAAKFNEYWYNSKSSLRLQLRQDMFAKTNEDKHYFDVKLVAREADDVNLRFETGSFGMYRFDAGFTRMGHVFAVDAKTLHAG
ncbi:MAG: hypothetical protein AABZ44_07955, partial [Elusimicrobiota bacterium]